MKRTTVLFIVTQLLLIGVIYLTIISFSTSDLISPDVNDKTIEIIGSDTSTGNLVLDPSGIVQVKGGKKVIWKIREGDGAKDVQWFDIEKKNPSQPDVFKHDFPGGNRQHPAVGHLKSRLNTVEFEYKINWTDGNGKGRVYDPKIAVRPGVWVTEQLLYTSYALLAVLITYMTFRRR